MATSGKAIGRRRFLQASIPLAGAAAWAGWHTLLFSPTHPKISRRRIALDNLPSPFEGLRIVQLSDLHHSDLVSRAYLEKCVDIAIGLQPDVVFLTGDFITMEASRSRRRIMEEFMEPLREILPRLRAPLGVFAVLGNHDVAVGGGAVSRELEKSGVRTMRNELVFLRKKGDTLPLVGLADYGTPWVAEETAFRNLPPGDPALIMLHSPDFFGRGMRHRNGLVFAGHTHGGQVRFPFIGPLYVPSRYGDRFSMGEFHDGGLTMIVNRGLGVVYARARLNCPPEIALVTLAAGNPAKGPTRSPGMAGRKQPAYPKKIRLTTDGHR